MIDLLKAEECTGCGACYNICPTESIEMVGDEKGFLYPSIKNEKCIGCKLCENVCPAIHKPLVVEHDENPETWAAWSLDENIRYESTSGGVFSELAIQILENNGIVCGARYNDKHMVEHCIITDKEDLSVIRQSKYIQSDTKKIYLEVKNYLQKNTEVLFCGTPCECAGLINYLGEKPSNLLVVDFVCRGANSPKVFQLFLHKLEQEYGAKVQRVWFKNKELGWRRFSTRVEFKTGEVYSKDRYSDAFIRGYIEANLYMRESCGQCKYKTMPRISDITLGDFWGIKSEEIGEETDLGTSLVMINSKTGKRLFEQVKGRIFSKERTFEEACAGNKCIYDSPVFNSKCKEFWDDIDAMDIVENILRYCKKRE